MIAAATANRPTTSARISLSRRRRCSADWASACSTFSLYRPHSLGLMSKNIGQSSPLRSTVGQPHGGRARHFLTLLLAFFDALDANVSRIGTCDTGQASGEGNRTLILACCYRRDMAWRFSVMRGDQRWERPLPSPANASPAASMVRSMSCSPWASERNPASNCEGAR